jgi:hypothetical protein
MNAKRNDTGNIIAIAFADNGLNFVTLAWAEVPKDPETGVAALRDLKHKARATGEVYSVAYIPAGDELPTWHKN